MIPVATTAQETAALLRGRRDTIKTLIAAEGWALMKGVLSTQAQDFYHRMIAAESSHEAAKFMGMHHALQSFLSWPEREIEAIDTQLKMLITQE